jgi:hypothetical protein
MQQIDVFKNLHEISLSLAQLDEISHKIMIDL